MTTFFENFKRICKEHGTTPTALLKKMGIAQNKATLWKNGSLPKSEMITALAKELNVYESDFFERDDKPVFDPSDKLVLFNADEKYLINLLNSLSVKDKHRVMCYVYDFRPSEDENA